MTALDLLRKLAIDQPWATSTEGLDDQCVFCGSDCSRWVDGNVVYVHDHDCDWVQARRFLNLTLGDQHEESTEPLALWWKEIK